MENCAFCHSPVEGKFCSRCGQAQVCLECGNKFTGTETTCSHCGVTRKSATNSQSEHGHQVAPNQPLNGQVGQSQQPQQPPYPQYAPKKKFDIKNVSPIVWVGAAIAVIVLVYFVFLKPSSPTDVVEDFVDAVSDFDFKKASKYLGDNDAKYELMEMQQAMQEESMFGADSVEFEMKIISSQEIIEGNEAEVLANMSIKISIPAFDLHETDTEESEFYLEKIGGKWKIVDIY